MQDIVGREHQFARQHDDIATSLEALEVLLVGSSLPCLSLQDGISAQTITYRTLSHYTDLPYPTSQRAFEKYIENYSENPSPIHRVTPYYIVTLGRVEHHQQQQQQQQPQKKSYPSRKLEIIRGTMKADELVHIRRDLPKGFSNKEWQVLSVVAYALVVQDQQLGLSSTTKSSDKGKNCRSGMIDEESPAELLIRANLATHDMQQDLKRADDVMFLRQKQRLSRIQPASPLLQDQQSKLHQPQQEPQPSRQDEKLAPEPQATERQDPLQEKVTAQRRNSFLEFQNQIQDSNQDMNVIPDAKAEKKQINQRKNVKRPMLKQPSSTRKPAEKKQKQLGIRSFFTKK